MQRIGFVVVPGFQLLALSLTTVFEMANLVLGEPHYDVHVLSEPGGAIPTSIGRAGSDRGVGRRRPSTR